METDENDSALTHETVIAAIGDGVIAVDAAGLVRVMNPTAEALTGWRFDEARGVPVENVLRLTRDSDGPVLENPVIRALQAGASERPQGPRLLLSRSGTRMPIEAVVNPVRSGDGATIGAVAVLREVIERSRAEAALRGILAALRSVTGQDFFRSLACRLTTACDVEYALVGTVDPDHPDLSHTIAVSHRGVLIDDFSYELRGTPCENVVGRTLCHYPAGVRQQFPQDRQLGELGIDSYMGIPLFSREGKPLGLLALMHDRPIACPEQAETVLRVVAARAGAELEREIAERELRQSEARLLAVIEGMPVILAAFGDGNRLVAWNAEAERVTGYGAEEMMGDPRAWERLYPAAAYRERMLAEGAARGFDFQGWVWEVTCKDGTTRTVEWTDVGRQLPIPGWATWAIGIDVTERKRLEDRLRQAQKMEAVGQLAGGVAHDFNNLLTIINGYTALMMEQVKPSDPLRNLLLEVQHAGERAETVTRQLLAFSRKQIVDPRPLSLSQLLADAEPMLRRLLREDIVLDLRLDPGLLPVNADSGQLHQIIMNLVANARDAMPTGGTVTVEAANVEVDEGYARSHPGLQPGTWVRVTVADTGGGIAPDILYRVFEPFFTTKEPGKGTGLGLATVYGIVKQCAGGIDVESVPGAGTVFTIHLPSAPVAPGTVAARAPRLEDPRGHETVLIVEDRPDVRRLTATALGRYGYRIVEAGGPREALHLAESHPGVIDLMLTDVVMPQMSGMALAESVKPLRPGMRVLFMSGYAEDVLARQGVPDGGIDLIEKPFTPEELAIRVRAALDTLQSTGSILVVDDEEAICRVFQCALETAGHQVLLAGDGKAALKVLREHPVAAVVLDLVMPGLEGIETIQVMRRDHPGVKIVAVSGAFEGRYLPVAKALGADVALAKPVTPERLVEEVRELLAAGA